MCRQGSGSNLGHGSLKTKLSISLSPSFYEDFEMKCKNKCHVHIFRSMSRTSVSKELKKELDHLKLFDKNQSVLTRIWMDLFQENLKKTLTADSMKICRMAVQCTFYNNFDI